MDRYEKDHVIDRMSKALEDLQDSFNSALLRAKPFMEAHPEIMLNTRLSELREQLFMIENDFEKVTGERLSYMIGHQNTKEIDFYGY
jgi:hypothetical protein